MEIRLTGLRHVQFEAYIYTVQLGLDRMWNKENSARNSFLKPYGK